MKVKNLNKEEIGKSNVINETKKEKEIRNADAKNGVVKVEKDKIVNEKKDIEMINKLVIKKS